MGGKMRISTWNVERLKHHDALDKILSTIEQAQADILVLTETDERIKLKYRYGFHTPKLHDAPSDYCLPDRYKDYTLSDVYAVTENRVSIYSNYPGINQYETYDKYTALCIELETEIGNLIVYGTIIGVIGNRDESFKQDILRQTKDYERLSKIGNICICGDYNCSFVDNYYFTNFGREKLNTSFAKNNIALITRNQPECIDHIALSHGLLADGNISISEYNLDKTLSDHKGTIAEISFSQKRLE